MHQKRSANHRPMVHRTPSQPCREAGLIGHLLGASSERAGNVAGVVVVTSMLMLVVLTLCESRHSADADELRQLFTTFATAGLGFLFGRKL